jgi:hypothetical protein
MSDRHSPEPWKIDSNFVVAQDGTPTVWIHPDDDAWHKCDEKHTAQVALDYNNAERIVACVNACQGWTTEELTDQTFRKTGMSTPCGAPGGGRPVVLLSRDTQWTDKAQECKEALKPEDLKHPIDYGD